MNIIYKTNGCKTTKSLTEWYFGKKFVKEQTEAAMQVKENLGIDTWRVFQEGTGYLAIEIH